MFASELIFKRRLSLLVVTWAVCMPLTAQTLRVLEPTPLRAERSPGGSTVVDLKTGQDVELLQMSGGWVQVQTGPTNGWMRASQLEFPAAQVAAISTLNTGRRLAGASAVTLGVRALPPRSTRHALIVGVGNYQTDTTRPVTALAGTPHDIVSAMTMARLLQVPPENMTVLRDAAATRGGVQQALRALDSRLQPGDRVFFYWSGHGSRYFDAAANACVETLVPYDLQDIGHQDFAQWLRPLAAKADKMLVVYDACHSAGVDGTSSIAMRSTSSTYAPKFTASASACLQSTNLRTRGWDSATRAIGLSTQDIVHISSARADEVAFDNAQSGGLATSSLLSCMQGGAKDLDGSGALSVDEIAACAQAAMESKLKPFPNLDPSHLVVSGNRAFVPAWFAGNPMPHVTAPATTPPSLPAPQPPTSVPSAIAAPALGLPASAIPETPATAPVQTVLEQIHAQRDSKRRVAVTLSAKALRIGADTLNFSVTSSHAGNVYIAMLGSDGQALYLLFPNDLDNRNRIEVGESMLLPRTAWRVAASGPKGTDRLLVMVTDGPRDLTTLGGTKVGPFSKPLTDARGRAQLQWLLGQQGQGASSECRGQGCSEAFGSALLSIEEY